jgi:helicase MOV-10
LTLAGDVKQLGPVTSGGLATLSGLDCSMMQRLMNTNELYKKNKHGLRNSAVAIALTNNYRSLPDLLIVPNRCTYEQQLVSTRKAELGPTMRFICVDGIDKREGHGSSRTNVMEAKKIAEVTSGLTNKSITVVTPYAAQVELVRSLMTDKKIRVCNVEQIQGQEDQVIILSPVKGHIADKMWHRKLQVGFSANPKRLNVMITRARDLLIIVGNPWTLSGDRGWANLILECLRRNTMEGLVNPERMINKLKTMWDMDIKE